MVNITIVLVLMQMHNYNIHLNCNFLRANALRNPGALMHFQNKLLVCKTAIGK